MNAIEQDDKQPEKPDDSTEDILPQAFDVVRVSDIQFIGFYPTSTQ